MVMSPSSSLSSSSSSSKVVSLGWAGSSRSRDRMYATRVLLHGPCTSWNIKDIFVNGHCLNVVWCPEEEMYKHFSETEVSFLPVWQWQRIWALGAFRHRWRHRSWCWPPCMSARDHRRNSGGPWLACCLWMEQPVEDETCGNDSIMTSLIALTFVGPSWPITLCKLKCVKLTYWFDCVSEQWCSAPVSAKRCWCCLPLSFSRHSAGFYSAQTPPNHTQRACRKKQIILNQNLLSFNCQSNSKGFSTK